MLFCDEKNLVKKFKKIFGDTENFQEKFEEARKILDRQNSFCSFVIKNKKIQGRSKREQAQLSWFGAGWRSARGPRGRIKHWQISELVLACLLFPAP